MEHLTLLDGILSYILNNDQSSSERIELFWDFNTKVSLEEVRTTHRIIYKIIENTITKASFIPNLEEFSILLRNNVDRYVVSKDIDINSIVSKEGFPLDLANVKDVHIARDALYGAVMDKFEVLQDKGIGKGEAEATVDALADYFQRQRIVNTLSTAHRIFFEGATVGKDTLAGLDVVPYTLKEFLDIDNIYGDNVKHNKTLVLNQENLHRVQALDEQRKARDLFSYGLSPIDEAFGKFRTGHTLAINGQEGVGKTRYAISLIIDCVINTKENIYFYCGEQDERTLIQMLTCNYAFTQGSYVEDLWVREGELSEDQAQIYNNMRLNLLTNPNYGTIILVTGRMGAKEITSHINFVHKFQKKLGLAVVDHMGLLQTEYQENRELQLAYQSLHGYGKDNNIGMVLLNHLNDDEVNRLVEGHESRTTGGAKTRESTRTPDYILSMSQSQKQKEVGKVSFQSPKARLGKSFVGFLADVLFGVSHFSYEE